MPIVRSSKCVAMPPEPVALLVKPLPGCTGPARGALRVAEAVPEHGTAAFTHAPDQPGLVWQFSCDAWPFLVRIIWWALRDRSG